MKRGHLVIAFVGRTWMAVVAVGLLMAFGIWGVGFAAYQHVLTGAAYATAVVVVATVSTGLLLGSRGRIDVTSDGVVLNAPFRSRTIRWGEIADVDMVFGRTWVRCRDSEGRIAVLLATSAWHPRTNRRVPARQRGVGDFAVDREPVAMSGITPNQRVRKSISIIF